MTTLSDYTTILPEDEGSAFDITDPKILVGVICGVTFVLATITVAICCSCGGGNKTKKKRKRPPQQRQQAYVVPHGGGPHTIIVVGNNNQKPNPGPSPRPQAQPRNGAAPGPTVARAVVQPGPSQQQQQQRPPADVGRRKDKDKKNKKQNKTKVNEIRMSRLDSRPNTEANDYIKSYVPAPTSYQTTIRPNDQTAAKLTEISEFFTRAFKKTLEAISIAPDRLKRQDVLGSGQYGVVYKGEMSHADTERKTIVALKTITGDSSDESEMQQFMEEVLRMKHFSNPHVMQLIGMTILDKKPYLVMPFMENGDLRSYLTEATRILTVEDLLKLAVQVSRGMEYLSGQNIIHGDLAARNCMVGADDFVKVSDFGLSRHLFNSDYYAPSDSETLRPFRWMAIECLLDQKFTIKGDVWSFGILLWEIMTRGQKPYPDIPTNLEVGKQLKKGYRMLCPEYCAVEIHGLMMKCWDVDHHNRPNFKDVTSTLQMLLTEAGGDYEQPVKAKTSL